MPSRPPIPHIPKYCIVWSINLAGKPAQPLLASVAPTHRIPFTTSRSIVAAAKKGFGEGDAKVEKKQPKFTRYLDAIPTPKNKAEDDFIEVPDVNSESSFLSKPIKPVILATGKAIMIYKVSLSLLILKYSKLVFKGKMYSNCCINDKAIPSFSQMFIHSMMHPVLPFPLNYADWRKPILHRRKLYCLPIPSCRCQRHSAQIWTCCWGHPWRHCVWFSHRKSHLLVP